MNPNLLKYILRKNYVDYKKGKISKAKYNMFLNKSYSYLNSNSFKSQKRLIKKDILLFKRLSK